MNIDGRGIVFSTEKNVSNFNIKDGIVTIKVGDKEICLEAGTIIKTESGLGYTVDYIIGRTMHLIGKSGNKPIISSTQDFIAFVGHNPEIIAPDGTVTIEKITGDESIKNEVKKILGTVTVDTAITPPNGRESFTEEELNVYIPKQGHGITGTYLYTAPNYRGKEGETTEVPLNLRVLDVTPKTGMPEEIKYVAGNGTPKSMSLEKFRRYLKACKTITMIETPKQAKEMDITIEEDGSMYPVEGLDFLVKEQKDAYIPRQRDKVTVRINGVDTLYTVIKLDEEKGKITIKTGKQLTTTISDWKSFIQKADIVSIKRGNPKQTRNGDGEADTTENLNSDQKYVSLEEKKEYVFERGDAIHIEDGFGDLIIRTITYMVDDMIYFTDSNYGTAEEYIEGRTKRIGSAKEDCDYDSELKEEMIHHQAILKIVKKNP